MELFLAICAIFSFLVLVYERLYESAFDMQSVILFGIILASCTIVYIANNI